MNKRVRLLIDFRENVLVDRLRGVNELLPAASPRLRVNNGLTPALPRVGAELFPQESQ